MIQGRRILGFYVETTKVSRRYNEPVMLLDCDIVKLRKQVPN